MNTLHLNYLADAIRHEMQASLSDKPAIDMFQRKAIEQVAINQCLVLRNLAGRSRDVPKSFNGHKWLERALGYAIPYCIGCGKYHKAGEHKAEGKLGNVPSILRRQAE